MAGAAAPLLTGHLYKENRISSFCPDHPWHWKFYYFVLSTDGIVVYYDSEEAAAAGKPPRRRPMALNGAIVGKLQVPRPYQPHAFRLIDVTGNKYTLAGETEAETEKWVAALKKAGVSHRDEGSSTSTSIGNNELLASSESSDDFDDEDAQVDSVNSRHSMVSAPDVRQAGYLEIEHRSSIRWLDQLTRGSHWTQRWVVLTADGMLASFESEEHAANGERSIYAPVYLEGACVRKPKSARRTRSHAFRIDLLQGGKVVLAAESASDAEQWIVSLVNAGVQPLNVQDALRGQSMTQSLPIHLHAGLGAQQHAERDPKARSEPGQCKERALAMRKPPPDWVKRMPPKELPRTGKTVVLDSAVPRLEQTSCGSEGSYRSAHELSVPSAESIVPARYPRLGAVFSFDLHSCSLDLEHSYALRWWWCLFLAVWWQISELLTSVPFVSWRAPSVAATAFAGSHTPGKSDSVDNPLLSPSSSRRIGMRLLRFATAGSLSAAIEESTMAQRSSNRVGDARNSHEEHSVGSLLGSPSRANSEAPDATSSGAHMAKVASARDLHQFDPKKLGAANILWRSAIAEIEAPGNPLAKQMQANLAAALLPATPRLGFVRACLRAKRYRHEKALTLARNYLAFRPKVGWQKVSSVTCAAVEGALRSGFNTLLSQEDKYGHIILTQSMRRLNLNNGSLEDHQRAGYYLLHRAMQAPGAQTRGITLLLDFRGFGLRLFGRLGSSDVARGVAMLQDCFPARLAVVYVLHEPIWIAAVFALLRPFLRSDALSQKVVLVGSDYAKLRDHLPPAAIPEALDAGGPDDKAWLARVTQWMSEEEGIAPRDPIVYFD